MKLDLTSQINELKAEKGIDEDLILSTIEEALTKAYLKYYGTTENLEIKRDDCVLTLFSKKEVMDAPEDEVDDLFEISLDEAKKIDSNAEVGDSMLIPCDVSEFGRLAINSARQIIFQKLKEIEKNSILAEFKSKQGEIIIGYVQRKQNNNIYVDIGSQKVEGLLLAKNQSPVENYEIGDRIKAYVDKIDGNKDRNRLTVILSRTSPELVRKLIEVEIPEISDGTVQIYKIVREAGYKTKIAVYTSKDDIDPVGSCVGPQGARIKNIIKELEGEKIDILRWQVDARMFIKNALTPAEVLDVIIVDEENKKAVAIVDEEQLSYAIGKRGANVKLANQLTEWDIDVLVKEDAIEQGIITDAYQEAENLFRSDDNEINQLDLPSHIKDLLFTNKIYTFEQLVELESVEDILALEGFEQDSAEFLHNFIDETFEVQEYSDEEEEEEEEEEYECPTCGAKITSDMTKCPNCGTEFSFEEVDEDEESEDEN